MNVKQLLMTLALFFSTQFTVAASEITVSQGKLAGVVEDGVVVFRGVPFASPPIGDLRFRSPVAPKEWQSVRDASQFADECYQMRFGESLELVGSQDCLYLNIYRPALSEGTLPVLVWFHGGGRNIGNTRRLVSDLVQDQGIMVVTPAYRLAHEAKMAHPALSAEDPDRNASGNYGFEDAIEALRWVSNEVEKFGGDAGSVTIGGMSGGGTMVCGLLLAPQARGLFHRAIIQSAGGCWFNTESLAALERRGESIAWKLLCFGDGAADCLRSRPPWSYYLAGGPGIPNEYWPWQTQYLTSRPIAGGSTGHNVDGYLFEKSWPKAFQSGEFSRVPILISTTEHEGRRVYGTLLKEISGFEMSDDDYADALEGIFGRVLGRRVAADKPLLDDGRSALEQYSDIGTEAHYTCPHSELARAVSEFTPTWQYEFRVPGVIEKEGIDVGSYHGSDTELLFGGEFWGTKVDPKTPDQKSAARYLRSYIGNFVRSGNPNGEGAPFWSVLSKDTNYQYLDFEAEPSLAEQIIETKNCNYWRDIGWKLLPGLHQ